MDLDALRKAAGDKVYARGESYHRNGHVDLVGADGHRVLARVFGSETYAVDATFGAEGLHATCTCPAYEDWAICKHIVAVALTVSQCSAADLAAGRGQLARLRGRLERMPQSALIDLVLRLALTNDGLFDDLDGEDPPDA
ncbi:SWIM zinc finger family protein [Phenylobacterium sp.]|uniref:SWIM zinc finger family protein n=1 Tax=Phenylobacterium sp. TaxID=1871053 RepID=UPI003D2CC2D3